MPIRPENKARYPKDWKQIRGRILERAKNMCEKCGVPNHERIERDTMDGWSMTATGRNEGVYIVLTIAHLDHRPENNDPANLRAWCQRCHNRYDAPMRAQGIKARRRALQAVGDLFHG